MAETGGEIDDLARLTPALLGALDGLQMVGRYLNPPDLPALVALLDPADPPLRAALASLSPWPPALADLRARLVSATTETLAVFDDLRAAAAGFDGARGAYRAFRRLTVVQETLYPLARDLPPISRFFLDRDQRRDDGRLTALSAATPRDGVGLLHGGGDPGARGGFSAYVPEDYDPGRAWPLVVALHGGAGNGRGFLWSWLRAARTHGAILIAPTAMGDTWALMDEDVDSPGLAALVDWARDTWSLDEDRLLLTGMSDGGTFTLLSGLGAGSPFTHLAPAATGFQPFLVDMFDPDQLAGKPIYLTHGAMDWMFPIAAARATAAALGRAGARVVWREMADLAHVYPSDLNAEILVWMAATPPRHEEAGG